MLNKKKVAVLSAVAVGAACVLCFALNSPSGSAAANTRKREPVSVAVATAAVQDLDSEVRLTADLKPFQEVEVMAKVSGYVKAIYVDIGARVRKGQLLAVLEVPELGEDLTRAQAALKRTEAEAERAKSELRRAQSAYDIAKLSYSRLSTVARQRPGLVAQQELDDVKSRELAAEAQVASAQSGLVAAKEEISENQAALAKIKTTLDFSRVTAPFDGVVTKRYADTGSMIQAGTASQSQAMPLVRLSQNSMLRLMVPVPESDVPTVHVGQEVGVEVPTMKRAFTGRVARFTEQVSQATRTMNTEIDVPNPEQLLVPGMYAEAKLTLGRRPGVLTVPVGAVDRVAGGGAADSAGPPPAGGAPGTVMVVTPDNRLKIQQVRVGMITATEMEILSGLNRGDRIVIGGRSSLQAGQEVRPRAIVLGGAAS